jgi:hypothetical protein
MVDDLSIFSISLLVSNMYDGTIGSKENILQGGSDGDNLAVMPKGNVPDLKLLGVAFFMSLCTCPHTRGSRMLC